MKPNTNQRRSRGRSGSHNGGGRRNSRNQNFESNGPEVKVRGSAQQVLDKYLQFARDAQSSGDRVKAEGYLQFAEHYYRIVNVDQDSTDGAVKRSGEDGNDQAAHSSADKNQTREPRRQRRKPNNGHNTERIPAPVPVTAKNEATLAAEGSSAAADQKTAEETPAESPKEPAVVGE